MNEVTRHICWHQNFVPWGLSAPANEHLLYKIRLQGDFLKLCPLLRSYIHVLNHENNCIKSAFKEISLKLSTNRKSDKAFLLTPKFSPLGSLCPCAGATCSKSWKKLYKIRLQRHFFKTCNKWMKWQDISVDIKTLSPGGCLPLLMNIYCIKSDFKEIFWNLQHITEVTRGSCWHQNFVPKGLSAPALGLYTCIKSWKNCIKSYRVFFLTCSKWSKWQEVSVDIKILSPGVVCPWSVAVHIY